MDKKHKGALSEMIAVAWLLRQGFEVYRNVSPFGPGDLAICDLKAGKIFLADVKTSIAPESAQRIGQSLTEEQRSAGVRLIYVYQGECFWFSDNRGPRLTHCESCGAELPKRGRRSRFCHTVCRKAAERAHRASLKGAQDPYLDHWPDAARNSAGCYTDALAAIRAKRGGR